MKIIKLILLGILTISVSCTEDEIEKFGRSDCDVEFTNRLNNLEDAYQEDLGRPDSEGNHQSLEACLNSRNYTRQYWDDLDYVREEMIDDLRCTEEDKFGLAHRINERIAELDEDLVGHWSHCEKIYGGG